MIQIVFGLSGKQGAGKTEAARYLVRQHGAKTYKMSEQIRQALKDAGIHETAESYAATAKLLFDTFGQDVLAKRLMWQIEHEKHRIVVVDGIRFLAEEDLLARSFVVFTHAHLYADIITRYERLKNRGEKPWEHDLSMFDFFDRELLSSEREIDSLAERTNTLVPNNESLTSLHYRIDRLVADALHEFEPTLP